ncbi:MAG UNVERIFIED_CONTAM: hypothetical protein LVR18_27445 [Planctomycetaceae bacterium]|jgi:hypothetical protein
MTRCCAPPAVGAFAVDRVAAHVCGYAGFFCPLPLIACPGFALLQDLPLQPLDLSLLPWPIVVCGHSWLHVLLLSLRFALLHPAHDDRQNGGDQRDYRDRIKCDQLAVVIAAGHASAFCPNLPCKSSCLHFRNPSRLVKKFCPVAEGSGDRARSACQPGIRKTRQQLKVRWRAASRRSGECGAVVVAADIL